MTTLKKLSLFTGLFILLVLKAPNAFGVVPYNDLEIPPFLNRASDAVHEDDFKNITDLLYKIYAPVISEKSGLKFIMNADWNDATVNAYAGRDAESWSVNIAGGIARAPGMSKDSFAFIVCHEIGHHLGGAPRTFLFDGWPSAEGQADYWAASKCLKKYYQAKANEEVSIGSNVPAKVTSDCTSVYKDFSEFKICIKSMIATIHFSNFLNELPDIKKPTSIESFDDRIVKGTNTNHYPRPQCRVDTVYSGVLCNIEANVATSETDAKLGHCNDISQLGARPRCWFKQP
ncbi:MAG: hypothetical protein K2Q18_02270 [Bdellovibrionales bacterium]|nr:hypothetical protein [Bdellovibrionales bacterium]